MYIATFEVQPIENIGSLFIYLMIALTSGVSNLIKNNHSTHR